MTLRVVSSRPDAPPPPPPPPPVDDAARYHPLLLSDPVVIGVFWPSVSALLERGVARAMHGEVTVDDIYTGAVNGKYILLAIRDTQVAEPTAVLIVVMELVNYSGFSALNIVLVAGSKLGFFYKHFWRHLTSWAYINGIRKIQGLFTPAMARLCATRGFTPMYTVMRMDLTETNNGL